MKVLSDIGEDALVERMVRLLPKQPAGVLQGPGDDCAVLRVAGSKRMQLLKTDVVVEGVHYARGEDMRRVGWKALCRAVSDIASMGGEPEAALVTVVAGRETPVKVVEDLYRGLADAARRWGVAVVGGETAGTTGPMVCNVALTGWVLERECVFRSGGSAGEVLYVTGRLGGSLKSGRHLDFQPRVREARWLVKNCKPTAMMDLSDGLGVDGARLAQASGCDLRLDLDRLPRNRGCSVEEALSDGEDFELLFAIPEERGERLEKAWRREFPRVLLTRVGALERRRPGRTRKHTEKKGGYDHFKKS